MFWKRLVQVWQSHRLYILLALAIAIFIAVSLLVPNPWDRETQARPSPTPSAARPGYWARGIWMLPQIPFTPEQVKAALEAQL